MTFLATDHLTDSAQRHLAGLRGELLNRLAALEAVLADPKRGESLAGMILDLSRIATEEAQAAAAEACLATKTEADRQMAELRESAKTALDAAQAALRTANESLAKERALSADLRRDIEQVQLELLKQSELLKAREEYEAEIRTAREELEEELSRVREQMGYEIDRQQAIATELARERDTALNDLRSRLENERTANAELRWSLERSESKLAALEREQTDSRASLDGDRRKLEQLQSELEQERASAAELRATHTEMQNAVAGLQSANAVLQNANAELQTANAELQTTNAELQTTNAELQTANAELQTTNAELQTTKAELQATETGLQAANVDLLSAVDLAERHRAELDEIRTRVEALTAERDAVASELRTAQSWIRELREAEAEFAQMANIIDSPAAVEPAAPAPPAPKVADSKEGWQPIQLANRYVFKDTVMVEVNNAPAALVDVSVSGCQLVTEAPLKPHQTVKVQLSAEPPLTCSGRVVWTRVESSGAGPRLCYRAGLRFTRPDEAAIEGFAAQHALVS
jgi:chromosome segregation ATPase